MAEPGAGGPWDRLTTPRLRLGRWEEAETASLMAMNTDPEVMRYFPTTRDPAATRALVAGIEAGFATRGWGLWAVTVAETSDPVGFVGLNPMPAGVPGAGGVEIGWRLARRAWGRGYALEAATAVLDLALGEIGLDEVFSMTTLANAPSRALMGRLGLVEHARYDAAGLAPDHPLRPCLVSRTTPEHWAVWRVGLLR